MDVCVCVRMYVHMYLCMFALPHNELAPKHCIAFMLVDLDFDFDFHALNNEQITSALPDRTNQIIFTSDFCGEPDIINSIIQIFCA